MMRSCLLKLFKVKCALTLVQDGIITKEAYDIALANKAPPLPKTTNLTTGKESTTGYGFNDEKWGITARGFALIAARIAESTSRFEKIERAAKELMRKPAGTSQQDDTMGEYDEFAVLADNYASSEDSD